MNFHPVVTYDLMAVPDPGEELPVVSNHKSSSWKESWTKSPHCG